MRTSFCEQLMHPKPPDRVKITFHPLDSNDPLLSEWLDLYESAFPPDERLPVEVLQHMLASGEYPSVRMLAALNESGELVGLVIFERYESLRVLFLWYLAVVPSQRSRGMGSLIYRQLIADFATGCDALVFDVEIPELGEGDAEYKLRARRIAFYHRQGARLLTGIDYSVQANPEYPPVKLHIMLHSFQPLSARAAFELAQQVIGPESVRAAGEPALA